MSASVPAENWKLKLFFSNSSKYIEIDTCVETGKQVSSQTLTF